MLLVVVDFSFDYNSNGYKYLLISEPLLYTFLYFQRRKSTKNVKKQTILMLLLTNWNMKQEATLAIGWRLKKN